MSLKAKLLFFIMLSIVGVSSQASIADKILRVGVYENPPRLILDQQGGISGILGDILQIIAAEQNWALEIVPCYWNDCLQQLARGEIDLLPDVAITDSREQLYDFHHTAALLSWSQVYVAGDNNLGSLLELDGKRLALVRGSVQYDYLQQLAENFNIDIAFVLVDTQQAAFAALTDG